MEAQQGHNYIADTNTATSLGPFFTKYTSCGKARLGKVCTAHGSIDTPCFMPVGTRASIKGILPENVAKTGTQIILCNTYHMALRPGAERVKRLGGLHTFMCWPRPILTDSGGFQIFSLLALAHIDDSGVRFRSHIDGAPLVLSPESAMHIQYCLDSNISMVLDECIDCPAPYHKAREAMHRSTLWAGHCRKAFVERPGYGVFGIVQGNVYKDLRLDAIQALCDIGFDGYAIGGLAAGQDQSIMDGVLEYTACALPENKPRYLMGIGKPTDIICAVKYGVDMFDCVLPTRSGRNAQAFTRNGTMNLRNAKFAEDRRTIDIACKCYACADGYTRAYIHHAVRVGEMIGGILITLHNLQYYQDLMRYLRQCIDDQSLYQRSAAELVGVGVIDADA